VNDKKSRINISREIRGDFWEVTESGKKLQRKRESRVQRGFIESKRPTGKVKGKSPPEKAIL